VTDRVVAGLDFYPTSVFPVGGAAPEWSIHERVAFAVAEFRRWHDRYDVPFWVAETSNLSLGINDQIPWLVSLTDGLLGLRNDGLPVRGLCWYSRGDQFDWQTELVNPKGVVTEHFCATSHTSLVTSVLNRASVQSPFWAGPLTEVAIGPVGATALIRWRTQSGH